MPDLKDFPDVTQMAIPFFVLAILLELIVVRYLKRRDYATPTTNSLLVGKAIAFVSLGKTCRHPRCLDADYAGTLIICDRMYGSFVPDLYEDMARCGLVRNIETFSLIRVAFDK